MPVNVFQWLYPRIPVRYPDSHLHSFAPVTHKEQQSDVPLHSHFCLALVCTAKLIEANLQSQAFKMCLSNFPKLSKSFKPLRYLCIVRLTHSKAEKAQLLSICIFSSAVIC